MKQIVEKESGVLGWISKRQRKVAVPVMFASLRFVIETNKKSCKKNLWF